MILLRARYSSDRFSPMMVLRVGGGGVPLITGAESETAGPFLFLPPPAGHLIRGGVRPLPVLDFEGLWHLEAGRWKSRRSLDRFSFLVWTDKKKTC